MIPIEIVIVAAAGMAMLGIAFAGIATDKHFIVIMLAIELILASSTILLVLFFSSNATPNPDALAMLVSIWAVAAVEIITLITFYVYMKYRDIGFDVTKLSKLKW